MHNLAYTSATCVRDQIMHLTLFGVYGALKYTRQAGKIDDRPIGK